MQINRNEKVATFGLWNSQRRTGRVKLAFGLGVLSTLCFLWFNTQNYSARQPAVCDDVSGSSTNRKRMELYEKLATDLDKNGPAFLDGGETSQSLKIWDLFQIVDNKVAPVHKLADPAVRANVLHLPHHYASKISQIVQDLLSPHFSKGVWFQDPQLYHFSLFHASHHLEPVPATTTEVDVESAAAEAVARGCCPLEIVLDRIVLTSTGVLLGCWQVLNGTDPAAIRGELRNALPRAPKKQLYAPEILHTSLARILGPPDLSIGVEASKREALALLKTLVLQLNEQLCNSQATVKDLWVVEELDVLALALNGRMRVKSFPFQCAS